MVQLHKITFGIAVGDALRLSARSEVTFAVPRHKVSLLLHGQGSNWETVMHCLSTIAKLHGGNTGGKSPKCQDRRCEGSFLADFSAGLDRLEAGLREAIDMIDRVQQPEEGAWKR